MLCLVACGRIGFDEQASDDAPTCGPEIDLETDPEHCGECEHSCLGGACVARQCQAFTLATQQGETRQLLVDDDFIYYTTPGSVKRIPKDARVIETIATYPGRGFRVALFGDYIYWTTRDTGLVARAIAKPGQTTEMLATGQGDVGGLVADGETVWWNNYPTGGRIFSRVIAPTGVPVELLPPTDDLTGMRLVDETLYFLRDRAGLFAMPAEGGVVTPIATGVGTFEMAIDGDDVFLAQADRLAILRVSLKDGTVQRVTDANGPWGIVVDETHVYFANEFGDTVARAPKTGGPAEVLAEVDLPVGIAVDRKAVYWSTIGGTVGMRAK